MGKLRLKATSADAGANGGPYQTQLSPGQEALFRNWIAANADTHPAFKDFNPDDPESDYDMRGWWQAAMNPDDPLHERTALGDSTNSVEPHFDDCWKTPYHAGFSDQSKFAVPGQAPSWQEDGFGGWNLVSPNGDTVKSEPDRTLRVTIPEDDQ